MIHFRFWIDMIHFQSLGRATPSARTIICKPFRPSFFHPIFLVLKLPVFVSVWHGAVMIPETMVRGVGFEPTAFRLKDESTSTGGSRA